MSRLSGQASKVGSPDGSGNTACHNDDCASPAGCCGAGSSAGAGMVLSIHPCSGEGAEIPGIGDTGGPPAGPSSARAGCSPSNTQPTNTVTTTAESDLTKSHPRFERSCEKYQPPTRLLCTSFPRSRTAHSLRFTRIVVDTNPVAFQWITSSAWVAGVVCSSLYRRPVHGRLPIQRQCGPEAEAARVTGAGSYDDDRDRLGCNQIGLQRL